MKEYIISEELANQILNYLAHRPWLEVEGMVHGLKGLKPLPPEELEDSITTGQERT